MGCASSADEGRDGAQEMAPAGPAKTNKNKASGPSPPPKAPAAVKSTASSGRSPYGPLSETQYVSRLAHSGTSREVQVPLSHGQAYTLQWAYASQRGYYPDQPNKDNQDALCALTSFGGVPGQHFFGVFDGHGEKGAPCAQFAADKLPDSVLQQPTLAVASDAAHRAAFLDVNRALRNSKVDDSLSGTTAITALLRGDSLLVANVGDSRACLAEDNGRTLTAFNLSCDQTPFRRDECARVRRAGARVMTLDQMEGLKNPNLDCWGTEEKDDDGDPPRLWVPNGMFPGTAFTRSLGDAVAERIGVIAEPEVECITLSPASRFAVIASDGVFEFLPSQAVVDMVASFDDPLEAALAVVSESYRLWLQYETRTDDITIIVLKFVGLAEALEGVVAAEAALAGAPPPPTPAPVQPALVRPMSAGARPGSANATGRPRSAGSSGHDASNPRPVRRTLAREKRAAITASLAAMAEDEEGPQEKETGAGAAEGISPRISQLALAGGDLATLSAAVKSCFLFSHLSDAQRGALCARFVRREVTCSELICALGDRADGFFVVASGEFDVYLGAPPGAGGAAAAPHYTYAVTRGAHPSFGELALLYNQPRTATVCARGAGALWVLSRTAFRGAVRQTDAHALLKTLRSVEVLKSLSAGQLQRLADCLSEVRFKEGTKIITQGTAEPDPSFFIIVAGTVACTEVPKGATPDAAKRTLLGANETFGERALLSANAARTRTCVAHGGPVTCLRMSKATFEELLGPLAFILDADRRWRERAARHANDSAALPSVSALRALTAADLGAVSVLWSCDVGRVAVARLAPGHGAPGDAVTLRQVAIGKASGLGREASVMRERELAGLIQPMPFIPAVMNTFADSTWLTAVLQTSAVCSLASAFAQPLSERAAAHYVAEAALALEHIHWQGCVFRGLSPDTALLDEDGHLQLCDFRFAKRLQDSGRTFTLCGHPEFLAPEQVQGTGHAEACDWWALGVFAWWLLTLHTPFAVGHADEELLIYPRITSRQLTLPPGLSPACAALLDGLLTSDQERRPGAEWLNSHPFFAQHGVDWEVLNSVMTDEVAVPPEAKAQLQAALEAHSHTADDLADVTPWQGHKWWDGF